MSRHQAVRGNPNASGRMRFFYYLLKRGVIRRLLEEEQPSDTTVEDMIRKVSSREAGTAGHADLHRS